MRWLLLFLACASCRAAAVSSTSAAVGAAPISPSAAPIESKGETESPPAIVERLAVAGDVDASIVRGAKGGPPQVVFLPGVCSNANAYLQSFPEAARRAGGVVAIEGDEPCAPGFRTLSGDAIKQEARIRAALAAAGLAGTPVEGLTLVGYSRGATVAERLVERDPARFPRVVLMGSPNAPDTKRLARATAVVTMSCSLDVPGRMKSAATKLASLGLPAKYVEMRGCTHGNISDGDAVFDETFRWLRAQE
jgi:pimeloyl-ACP methyl ester carboxylesterase